MRNNNKRWAFTLAGILLMHAAWSQMALPVEMPDTPANAVFADNDSLMQYAVNKQLPAGYETEALQALAHFPELKNVPIRFRITKSFSTLKTRPTFWSMLMPKGHRSYVITISNKTTAKLMPLMFENLSEEARIGVIGHELSHVLDFSRRTDWQCLKSGVGHLSPRYLDRFEYNTDMICIQHGLGQDLKAWSSYIRKTMHTVFWRGTDYVYKGDPQYERYMNPSTIDKNMPASNNGSLKTSK